MSLVSDSVVLPKFEESNFSTWSNRVVSALCGADLDDVLVAKAQNQPTDAALAYKWTSYDRRSAQVYALLCQSLPDSVYNFVGASSMRTAVQLWDKLAAEYAAKSSTSQMALRMRLQAMRMTEGDNPLEFVSTAMAIVEEIKARGGAVVEADVVCKVLAALPRSYEALVQALWNVEERDLTLAYVKARLARELHLRAARAEAEHSTLLAASGGRGRGARTVGGAR